MPLRDGSRWRCAKCGTREASPISETCPNCGTIGERYPVNDPQSDQELGFYYAQV